MIKKAINSILNFYYKHPIIIDIGLANLLMYIIHKNKRYFKFDSFESNVSDILSNVISTNVSFSGFILACLTIIVSFKANIKVKNINDADNALELLLLSKSNYRKILSTFRDAIIELVLSLGTQYLLWLPIFGLKPSQLLYLTLFGVLIIFFTLVRTLYLLFRLVFQEFHSDEST